MIYTIGFHSINGTEPITRRTNISQFNPKETTILISANGPSREEWEKIHFFSHEYKFQGILPTVKQKEQLYYFIKNGGTVISSLPNPYKSIETTIFYEELNLDNESNLIIHDDGTTMHCIYKPFDWLLYEMEELADIAYNYEEDYDIDSGISVKTNATAVTFYFGENGGRLIFTKVLNNRYFRQVGELNNIINKHITKDEKHAVTR